MAMKALTCPQCGADLELDDSKEFGFCAYCGAKIMLGERVTVNHTGQVQMKLDNSEQGRNRLLLGGRAFSSGNYEEAYRYYTLALEDLPRDVEALSRKGICAVRLSSGDSLRLNELAAGGKAALEAVKAAPEEAGAARVQMDNDMAALGWELLEKTSQCLYQCVSADAAKQQAARWSEAARAIALCVALIANEGMVESLALAGIERCDTWLELDKKGKISYYVNTTTSKEGKRTDHYRAFLMPDARRQAIAAARKSLADRYNSLSARVEKTKALTEGVEKLRKESTSLKAAMDKAQRDHIAAKKAFWAANPEYAAQRDKKRNLTWIAVGVGALLLLISVIVGLVIKNYGVIALGAVALVVTFLIRHALAKHTLNKMERELFPDEIKQLAKTLDEATSQWVAKESEYKNKQGELAAYEKTKK